MSQSSNVCYANIKELQGSLKGTSGMLILNSRIPVFIALLAGLLWLLPVAMTETNAQTVTEKHSAARFTFVGKLVLASPEMPDPRFKQTVILMIRHDQEGAMGLIINRPVAHVKMQDFLKRLNLSATSQGAPENQPLSLDIYYGGPVLPDNGFVLHSPEYKSAATTSISSQFSMTSDLKVLQDIAQGAGPKQWMFILGYAGWAAGQLEDEILNGDWTVTPADPRSVFEIANDLKWPRLQPQSTLPL